VKKSRQPPGTPGRRQPIGAFIPAATPNDPAVDAVQLLARVLERIGDALAAVDATTLLAVETDLDGVLAAMVSLTTVGGRAAARACPEEVIAFPDGLPGFEGCRRFVMMSVEGAEPFECLQGLDASSPAFLTIDPARVLQGYRLDLSPADCRRLDAQVGDALTWLAIVTVGPDETATVNLRAPIVINSRPMIAFWVMPYDCLYPLRHPLSL
jgi:flagellar assembly factor FliW